MTANVIDIEKHLRVGASVVANQALEFAGSLPIQPDREMCS